MVGYTNERSKLLPEVQALLNREFLKKPIKGLTDGVELVAELVAVGTLNLQPKDGRRRRVDIGAVVRAAAEVEQLMETGVRVTYGGSK